MVRLVPVVLCVTLAACGSNKPSSNTFRVAFLADTHLTDQWYVGPENTPLDTSSVLFAVERLGKARDTVNRITPAVEQVFVAGDIVHDFASTDLSFYSTNKTVFDTAHDLFAGFNAPVHLGMGNHDYNPPTIPRSMSETLFETKLGMPAPYYSVDYKGWRFIHLNCFQGNTWDPTDPDFPHQTGTGSFGLAQLQWLESQLSDNLPTVLIFHIPVPFLEMNEFPNIDFFSVVDAHTATIKMIIAGHLHLWYDFTGATGSPQMVIASTRYDESSFAIADLTTDTHEFNFVHQELWHMMEHETDPWPASELK